jgi:L-amino acid N-acyltransferase
VRIRLAADSDADAIRTIYNRQVLESTVTTDIAPRTPKQQREWLNERSGAHAVLVAEIDDEIVGFASLSPYRSRPAYSTTVEDSVYIAAEWQGRGVGRELLVELLELAQRHGFHSVMARVVGDHASSIRLHTSLGFELVGIEREVGRKFGRWLDVAVLQKLL